MKRVKAVVSLEKVDKYVLDEYGDWTLIGTDPVEGIDNIEEVKAVVESYYGQEYDIEYVEE